MDLIEPISTEIEEEEKPRESQYPNPEQPIVGSDSSPVAEQPAQGQDSFAETYENILASAQFVPANIGTIDTGGLNLKYLKQDENGLGIEIPREVVNEIEEYQKFFEPIFLETLPPYTDSKELSDIDTKNPFCFSPKTLEVISEKIISPIASELSQILSKEDFAKGKEASWKRDMIDGILGKLLALESFRMSRVMATNARKYVEAVYPEEDTIRVREYCTGAGINTALLYLSLARLGKNVEIQTADYALQSVACSAGFLTACGIPVRIVLDENAPDTDFNGVTIHYDTASHFSQRTQEKKDHIIVSDSGLNYLPENGEILENMKYQLDEKGMVQICTLDPSTEINLSVGKMLSTIAFGKHPEIYKKHIGKIYDTEEVLRKMSDGTVRKVNIIKQMFSASTSLQYNILQKLFKLDNGLFWKYLNGAKTAAAMTQKLSPEIKIDLRESGKVLGEVFPNGNISYEPAYEEQPVSITRILELKSANSNGEL